MDVERSEETSGAEGAARLIWQCWTRGERIDSLPLRCRPENLAAGYAAQEALERVGAEPVVGWKIAASSAAGQAHIAVPGPIAGRLFDTRVHHAPSLVSMGSNQMAVAEAEFAFVLGCDLPARAEPYGLGEVLDAIDALHPAIEIPDSRFSDYTLVGQAQLAADNACANEFVLGPRAGDIWRSLDLAAHRVELEVNGHNATTGYGADALGDPLEAFRWLANSSAVNPSLTLGVRTFH